MALVTHLIESLSNGGGARATIYLAKYSAKLGDFRHRIISIKPPDPIAVEVAAKCGVEVLHLTDYTELFKKLDESDLVQVSWWNNPTLYNFFQLKLPEMRLLGWMHVGGAVAPQNITQRVIEYFDYSVACSPYTFRCPAFKLAEARGHSKLRMVYGASDFERLEGITPKSHAGFNIGYIGTIHPQKIHPRFASMCLDTKIPDVKFIMAGSGGHEVFILDEARKHGKESIFDYRGFVEDVGGILEELDVYGYPLCEETYAASEMNLQEVLYAGVPPVVFPYGGIKDLIVDNYTGLFVHTPKQYSEALEFLYHNPHERTRLGANARNYAQQIFGAENAGKKINEVYAEALLQPKRERSWFPTPDELRSGTRTSQLSDQAFAHPADSAVGQFIDSIGDAGTDFLEALFGKTTGIKIAAEKRIASMTELMKSGGLGAYAGMHPEDPTLRYWIGLISFGQAKYKEAAGHFIKALTKGKDDWQLIWWLSESARRCGETKLANDAHSRFEQYIAALPEREQILAELNASH